MDEKSSATKPTEAIDATEINSFEGNHRPVLRPEVNEQGKKVVTPEMRALADALTHPEGDPYLNGRKLGFYCEQCG